MPTFLCRKHLVLAPLKVASQGIIRGAMKPSEQPHDSLEDVWELLEFCSREALFLRSFLEYLRLVPDPPEKKRQRLENWRKEIGLQLGEPKLANHADALFRKIRAAPPQERAELLRSVLGTAYAVYFGESAK